MFVQFTSCVYGEIKTNNKCFLFIAVWILPSSLDVWQSIFKQSNQLEKALRFVYKIQLLLLRNCWKKRIILFHFPGLHCHHFSKKFVRFSEQLPWGSRDAQKVCIAISDPSHNSSQKNLTTCDWATAVAIGNLKLNFKLKIAIENLTTRPLRIHRYWKSEK